MPKDYVQPELKRSPIRMVGIKHAPCSGKPRWLKVDAASDSGPGVLINADQGLSKQLGELAEAGLLVWDHASG